MKKPIVAGNFLWGAFWSFRVAVSAFIAEAVALVVEGLWMEIGLLEIGAAVAMSAFVAGVLGLAITIVVAPMSVYVAGAALASELATARLRAVCDSLCSPDREVRRGVLAQMVAVLLFLLVGLALAVWPVQELIVTIQTAFYGALLAVITTAGAFLLSWLAWPVWRRTGRLAASALPNPPSPAMVLAGVSTVLLATFILFSVLTWTNFAVYLPWRPMLTWLGTVAVFVLWVAFRQRSRAGSRNPVPGVALFLVLIIGGLAVTVFLPPSLQQAGGLVAESKGPLALGYALFARIADRDGDGHLSVMGGGDCAATDPHIHPGAREKPGDHVDQNCDGHDSNTVLAGRPGRHDYASSGPVKQIPIILVTVDAVSALRMDLHGYKRKTMPSLTKRAAKGVVFNWAFSEGPASRLSVPSLVAGRHNSQIRRKLSRRTLVPWQNVRNTLGTVFSRAGYHTEVIAPDLYFAKAIDWIYMGFDRVDTSVAKGRAGQLKNGNAVTRTALARLDAMKNRKRFLLWVHYTDAHYPHRLPEGVEATFGEGPGDIYDRELLMLDGSVEQLMAGIEERMAGRDYIVALTADHGQAFDKKHQKFHQDHDLSTAVTWVPMIFWSPFSAGKRVDRVANIIDMLPTLMNMVGIQAEGVSGDSLLPTILGNDSGSPTIMQQFYLPEYRAKGKDPLVRTAVRREQFVLHQNRGNGREELYDYRADPLETKNLIGKLPDVARELRAHREAILSWAYESWNNPDKTP